jgi:hypothetical protein
MSLKYVALTAATFALCAAVNPTPAAAQALNCGDMYNRVMQIYQAAPQSPEYAQMSATYSASCAGPSAGSVYPSAGYPSAGYPSAGYPSAMLRLMFTGRRSASGSALATAVAGVAAGAGDHLPPAATRIAAPRVDIGSTSAANFRA